MKLENKDHIADEAKQALKWSPTFYINTSNIWDIFHFTGSKYCPIKRISFVNRLKYSHCVGLKPIIAAFSKKTKRVELSQKEW